MRNANLVNGYLAPHLSMHAACVGIFSVIAIIMLAAPMVVTDRSRGVNLLHGSSKTGRRIFAIQLAATLASAVALSVGTGLLSAIPWLFTDAPKYWDAHLMQEGSWGMFLYNITFGQYVMILFGSVVALCAAASGIAFVLARFSSNAVTLMLKAVPAAAALSVLTYAALNMAFGALNIVFSSVFRGKLAASEIIVVGAVFVLGIAMAVAVVKREKRVDLA